MFRAMLLAGVALAAQGVAAAPAKDCTLAGGPPARASVMGDATIPFPPVQLDVRVDVAPTHFASGGFQYLVYELQLRNHSSDAMAVRALEIVDAGDGARRVVASIDGDDLQARLLPVGAEAIDAEHPLEGGKLAVAMLCLAFADGTPVPATLGHRLRVGDVLAAGPEISTRGTALKVLAPPVRGKDWVADNGPSLQSHHRMGLLVIDGRASISRRYAIDFRQARDGETFEGDARDPRAYFAYGETVYAVADATVVSAQDGLPDNVPRTEAGFEPAVALDMQNVMGNAVVLDLGDGQFAHYAHLQPGSVRVKPGDRVRRGDVLGRVGNSGDARWPHLHFQVGDSPHILASEGLPFVFDAYRAKDADGRWTDRREEYPIGDIAIEIP